MCERAHCHGGETNCFSSTCLDVCAECPPSAASKPHTKTCHWRFEQWVRIPCEQCEHVGKNDQHGLDIVANLMSFFRPRWIWRLPLRRLLLSLRVITIHQCFITGYDTSSSLSVTVAVRPSFCPSTWNNSAQNGWNLMTFHNLMFLWPCIMNWPY